MKRRYFFTSILVSLMTMAAQAAPKPPAGFTALFNGTNLDGWWGAETEDPRGYMALSPEAFKAKHDGSLDNIRQHWHVENDELVNDGQGLYLTTDKFYGDFELLVDYRTVPLADSGIYLRGCPQVQIWDYTEKDKFKLGADKGSGALWNNSPGAPGKDPLVLADKPFGKWNHFRIVMAGSRVWVWLNGKQTVKGANMEDYYDRKLPVPPKGPLQLQTHGGEIRWRNLYIREIGSDEADKLLRGKDPKGFHSVFNGKDFTGWAGPLDNYQVKDGAILCRPGKGGTIYTKDEYCDFVARLQFKLPPGGNNGLAIRYPGNGDTAYLGMCEVQVLDDNYEKATGDKIDPRQAHG
ncbi:MAG: 3-keto-disaccharide hydrolase, partial [Limisphaerales bacterium]